MHIHTDGSCLGNPGPGGWAAVLTMPGTNHRLEISGGFRLTTNNRMELFAAIKALEALKESCEVVLFTDSRYLRNAVEKNWLENWQRNNWRKADKKPVLNVDLWQRLQALLVKHVIKMHWLKGHSGIEANERCDSLARACAKKSALPADEIFEAQENM